MAAASEKTDPAVLGDDEGGDSIGKFNNGHQIGDQQIPNNPFSFGQELNLGIINQFGQLIGEYSKLDDELWFCKPEDDDDDETMAGCNEGLDWNCTSTYENPFDPEHLSKSVDNSVSDGGTTFAEDNSSSLSAPSLNQCQTPSPVSVLQRRRSYSDVTTNTSTHARRKCQYESAVLDGIEESLPANQVRTRKISELLLSGFGERWDRDPDPKPTVNQELPTDETVKKCMHCESTETPQWREGPMGRKTLCNACGVQYKFGRLFPDYRPLKSPTFDPYLHTNLPKKVQKMRRGNRSVREQNIILKPQQVQEMSMSNNDNNNNNEKRNQSPNLKPNEVQELGMDDKSEGEQNLNLKPKQVQEMSTCTSSEKRNQSPNLEPKKVLQNVGMNDKSEGEQNFKLEPKQVQEASTSNSGEKDQSPNPRPKRIQVIMKKSSDLLQSGSMDRNQKLGIKPILKRKLPKVAVKKCLHCESTKTPQWREGPMGPRTLCNACGVQYRAGRLFPEYRPLHSPTFDPSLHSNLPKKVQQMRLSRATEKCAVSGDV